MAPALTAEPLSPKEKLTSTASPSARSSSSDSGAVAGGGTGGAGPGSVAKKPSTPTPATATTRVTRSREAAAVAAAAAAAAAGGLASSPAATIPQLRSSQPNNKRKSGGNKPSNEPAMGLSTAPTPHSSSSSASAGPSTPDAGVASTSASPAVVEKNNNSSSNTTNTHSSSPKDNSTAQLLADLTINFEEAISAEICLRKTLPEVSLGKEPATTPAAATSSSSTTESPGVSGEAAAEDQSIPAEEELSKIETDNIEERLSQLDGNVIAMSEELPPPPPEPEPPTTPSRQQQTPVNPAQDSPRLQATPQQQQLTPQSTAGSINFLKDGAAGAVLEDQDIEEVLKALKTFDGAHVNPDAICDFFNEVWEEAPPAASMSATAAPASSAPELPDIKPSFSGTSILPSTSSLSTANVSVKQERPWEESHAELEQQQHVITRRIDFLLRRMRKFQARQMCRHASGEVAGILEWSARSSHKTPNPARSATLSEREATVLSIVSGRPDCAFWEEQKKHPLPASQMSSVIRHIGTAARHQQICHTATGTSATLAPSSSWFNSSNSTTLPGKRPRKNQLDTTPGAGTAAAAGLSATGAAAVTTGSSTDPNTPRADDIVPGYDTYVTSELTHVAGLLHTELREVQNAIDSDATESSSGGESADEMVTYNNTQQQSLPMFLVPERNELQRDFYERYCAFATDGPAWTVIQNRGVFDPAENFNRSWDEYRAGFGHLSRDFWFGNEFTHKILYRDDHELRVELGYNQGEEFPDWAEYSLFRLDSEGYNYQLAVDGVFRGSLPDALEPHIHLDFSTYDRRNDGQSAGNSSCAEHYGGGWWLDRCTRSNLNGEHGNQRAGPAILWSYWGTGTDTPKTSRMMIRPVNFDSGGDPANSYEN